MMKAFSALPAGTDQVVKVVLLKYHVSLKNLPFNVPYHAGIKCPVKD
jgi:hypothetical protein